MPQREFEAYFSLSCVINSSRLGRRLEFMFSNVLDCRQSLSEFSLCLFSTWLRGHWLDCVALFEVPISPSDIGMLS